MDKKSARKFCFKKLKTLNDKKNRDLKISEKLHDIVKDYENVGIYMPIKNECVLSLSGEYNLCYPKVFDKEMKFFDSSKGFTKSKFGILEPNSVEEIIPDIIIAPCVGVYNNYRLGYGGGYYDRYLETHEIYVIAIAYAETVLDSLDVNKYDIAADEVMLV